MLDQTDNLVLPFQLESSLLRGRLVRAGDMLDTTLNQHAYPANVAQLLAETIVIAAALASSLKYDGVFTVQAKGDGVVQLLVADVTSNGGVRAYAQFDEDKLSDASVGIKLLGNGFLAFTCAAAANADRYQGIVELEGETLSAAVQQYFRQSEQVPTGILASASRDSGGLWRGGCLLLQRMPGEGGFCVECASPEAENWTRAMIVMETCAKAELTDANLPAEALLFRLFHEEGVRVYEPKPLSPQCRCSQERVEAMLKSLPRDEVEALVVGGLIAVTCEFCSKTYAITEPELAGLYSASEKKA
jgi:molecular chaperone Hsp33